MTTFTFGHGHLGVTSPTDAARTSQQLTLAASANRNVGALTWQRVNAAGSTVALTQLKDTNGNTVTQPVTISGGVVPTLTWDVETELGSEPDGPVRLTADVRTTSAPTVPVATRMVSVTYDRNDFAMVNATSSAGPGVVNLVTGNFQTSETDAVLSAPGSDLQIGRTFNSRDDDAEPNGPFGPGWVMSAPVESAGSPTVDWPNGLRSTSTVDETGSETALTYAATSGCSGAACTVFAETVHESVHGQWLARASTLSEQAYTYDAAARLTAVADSVAGSCETRRYTFDTGGAGNSNRTKLETFAPAADGACQTTTASPPVTSTFDAADRITTTGTVYDALGRTLEVPDGDALDSGDVTVAYHVNDLVRSVGIAGGVTKTYTLDVDQQRIRSWTDGTTTKTNHHDGDGDNPSWTQESATAWTRTIGGIDGDLAAIHDSATSAATLQLTNLHGDVVATASTTSTTLASTMESTEYGTPRGATGTRYAWLGGKQRAADTPSGVTLMGVRVYSPSTGRFLQVDPVYGGNVNAYAYPTDPIGEVDLDGRICFFGKRKNGGCRGGSRRLTKRAGGMYRFGLTLPISAPAAVWARGHGARCSYSWKRSMMVCTGARGGYGRGGTTIGSTFMTGRQPDYRLVRHESKHANQWLIPGFPLLYGAAEFISGGGARNPFERQAGLRDGCYRWRHGCRR